MKILLAEDNELNRDMLSRRLRRRGFEVIEAHDGEVAVQRVRDSQPDIVLLDLSMPVIDGWEAARILREDEATRRVPIIALTAHAIRSERDRALEAGCDEVVTKPFEFADLLEVLDRWSG